MATWQELYRQSGNEGQPVSDQNKITQTREQFLQKYANAIDANGRFIPGKANLWFDDEDAGRVYDQLIGKQSVQTRYGNRLQGILKEDTFFNPEVNMDWIEDPRTGGGWASMKGAVLPGMAATAAILGGQALLGTGLAGGSAGGASAGSSAFGGANSFAGANAVTAGDLALTAMPQVTPAMVGLSGAEAAGIGAASGAGLMGDAYMPANLGANGSEMGGLQGLKGTVMNGVSSLTGGVKALNDLTGGNLGAIAGGLLGAAAGQDSTTSTTSQKDPWKPAQPYLLENLKKNAALQEQYAQNPFSDQQKAAYQNSFNNSDNFRNNVAPGLLNMVNSFQPYQRQQTAVGGGYKPAAQTGLLSPNMQAPQGQSIGQIDWSQFLPRG